MTSAATLQDPRLAAAEIESARRGIESLVCGMPGDPHQRGFEHPWEIRAFAMAVAAHQQQQFDWSQFQAALIASIQDWEGHDAGPDRSAWSYYEHWVNALESVIAEHGLPGADELENRTAAVLAQPASTNHHEAHPEPIAIDPARTRTP